MTLPVTPADARALEHARDHVRRAAAALRALEPTAAAEVAREHAQLVDVQGEIEAVLQRAVMREERR